MCWVFLILAGLFETFWAVALKLSQGFSRPVPAALTVIGMAISFYLLSRALESIPLGMGYAIWTGIGIVGTFIISVAFLHDSMNLGQGICIVLILAGILGLRLSSAG